MADGSLASTTAETGPFPQVSGGRGTRRTTPTGRTLATVPDDVPGDGMIPIPTARGAWGYSTGSGPHPRGVYRTGTSPRLAATLPYAHLRVIYRDGAGAVSSVSYLLSVEPDGARTLVSDHDVKDGSWAAMLGVPSSADDQIVKVAATAIRMVAYAEDVEVRDAAPAVDDAGLITVPVPESLPAGYLKVADGAGPDLWREIVKIVTGAGCGKLAFVLAATAFAPYIGPLGRKTFIIDVMGEAGKGKSTTGNLCGAVWGNPGSSGTDDGGVVVGWDVTTIGAGRFSSELRYLPMFFDESGMSGLSHAECNTFAFRTCESGGARLAARRNGPGMIRGRRWRGQMMTTGNDWFVNKDTLTGKYAGLLRRVLWFEAPLTPSAEVAESLDDPQGDEPSLVMRAHGWLGVNLLNSYPIAKAREAVRWAETVIGLPSGSVGRSLAKHCAGALAGALMMDRLLGTGKAMQDAVLPEIRAYLDRHGHEPEHDAERVVESVRAAIIETRSAWPYEWEYLESENPRPDMAGAVTERRALPQRGVSREIAGVVADDETWLMVLPESMAALCDTLGVSRSLVFRKLHETGRLKVSPSVFKRGEWVYSKQIGGKPVRGYLLTVSPWAEPTEDAPEVPAQPDAPAPQLDPVDAWVTQSLATISTMGMDALLGINWAEYEQDVAAGAIRADQIEALRTAVAARIEALRPRQEAIPTDAPEAPELAPEPVPAPAVVPAQRSAPARPEPAQLREGRIERQRRQAAAVPALDMEPVAKAKAMIEAGKDAKTAMDWLRRQAIPQGMALLLATRAEARFDLVKFPPMPEVLHRPDKNSQDEVWESRPNWTRKGIEKGTPVNPLDVNAAYCSAFVTQLPNGRLRHSTDGDFKPRESGVHLIDVFDWPHEELPHPLGAREESGKIWVPSSTLKLLVDLSKDTKSRPAYLPAPPKVYESWTSGSSESHLRVFRDTLIAARRKVLSAPEYDEFAYEYIKAIYSKFVSTLGESKHNFEICRPDWMHIIRSQAYANLWRKAETAHLGGLTVAKVAGTDELHVIGEPWSVFADGRDVGKSKDGRAYMKSKGVYEFGSRGGKR